MKKICMLLAMLMLLCSCGTEKEVVTPTPEPVATVETTENLIEAVDAIVNEVLGEYILITDYSEDTGVYMMLMTMDGIEDAYNTSEFKTVCGLLDDLSVLIHDDMGVDNVILLVSDNDIDICLYATDNGEDITFIFN